MGNGPIHHFHRLFTDATKPRRDFSAVLWRDIEVIRLAIFELPFVRALGSGALAEEEFSFYLAQDALYLSGFSRALERASALAPHESARLFLAQSAQQCAEVESELHRNWLRDHTAPTLSSPATE